MSTTDASAPPSEFLAMGFPSCSIFGETWHELAAQAYLVALVAHGDVWQPLTLEQVQEAARTANGGPGFYSTTLNHERVQRVADKLTSAEDAKAFSWAWRREANIDGQ